MVISQIGWFKPSNGELRAVARHKFFERQRWLPGDCLDDVVRPREDAVLLVLRHAGDVLNSAWTQPGALHLGNELWNRQRLIKEGPAERRA
jgi:hypothetical protein